MHATCSPEVLSVQPFITHSSAAVEEPDFLVPDASPPSDLNSYLWTSNRLTLNINPLDTLPLDPTYVSWVRYCCTCEHVSRLGDRFALSVVVRVEPLLLFRVTAVRASEPLCSSPSPSSTLDSVACDFNYVSLQQRIRQ